MTGVDPPFLFFNAEKLVKGLNLLSTTTLFLLRFNEIIHWGEISEKCELKTKLLTLKGFLDFVSYDLFYLELIMLKVGTLLPQIRRNLGDVFWKVIHLEHSKQHKQAYFCGKPWPSPGWHFWWKLCSIFDNNNNKEEQLKLRLLKHGKKKSLVAKLRGTGPFSKQSHSQQLRLTTCNNCQHIDPNNQHGVWWGGFLIQTKNAAPCRFYLKLPAWKFNSKQDDTPLHQKQATNRPDPNRIIASEK